MRAALACADCELLAMLDLYLEWVPDPLAALRARDRAADASAADKLARAAASATPRGSALADADADALADRLHTLRLEDVLVVRAARLVRVLPLAACVSFRRMVRRAWPKRFTTPAARCGAWSLT